jgi:apolipoprotein N-acyltransferase
MDNIDHDAMNALSGELADGPTSRSADWFQIVWIGIIWFALTSLIIWFWLREALTDPFQWWLWLSIVVPVAGVALALVVVTWKRWTAKR